MPPEVLLRKLTYLRQLLADLAPYKGATLDVVKSEHYKLERLLELLVMTASDILFHELAGRGIQPTSYRDAFRLAGEQGLLPKDLSERLQEAAAMRNVLVHMYETIDYEILAASIDPALHDLEQFLVLFNARLEDKE